MTMEHRRIGTTDLDVSVLGFGCASIGSRAGSAQSTRALTAALDAGITYFDTADMYGMGASESLLGRMLGGSSRRDQIVISTKCGYTYSTKLKALSWVKPLVRPVVMRLRGAKRAVGSAIAAQKSQCFETEYLGRSVNESLRRLRTDRIDLFFLHDPPMAVVERDDAFEALRRLNEAGKVRHFGVSCDVDVAERLLTRGGMGIAAVQVNVNIMEQAALAKVVPMARAKDIGVIARGPFGHGHVLDDARVQAIAQKHGVGGGSASLASVALRFAAYTHGVSSVLAGMMRPEHLASNMAAIARGPLNEQERVFATDAGRMGGGSGAGG